MPLEKSNADRSRSFDLLDERIKRWIWTHEWTELRDVQERAIPLLLARDRDVVISAAMRRGSWDYERRGSFPARKGGTARKNTHRRSLT
jgi:hypothetical protein